MTAKAKIAYAIAGPLTAAYGFGVRPLAPLLARRFASPYRVHLGSGLIHLEGWVNVDWAPIPYCVLLRQPGPDLYADLARSLPFATASATHVYANNFLEHLDRPGARCCLREAARILAPGGRIRIVVPDAGAYARAYAAGDEEFFSSVRNGSDVWPDVKTPLEHLATIVHGSAEHGWRHLWAYDYETLERYLTEVGFTP